MWRDVQVDKVFKKHFCRAVVREESVSVDVVEITTGWVRSPTSQWRQISNVETEKIVQPALNCIVVSVTDRVG